MVVWEKVREREWKKEGEEEFGFCDTEDTERGHRGHGGGWVVVAVSAKVVWFLKKDRRFELGELCVGALCSL